MNSIQEIESHPQKEDLLKMLRFQLAKDLGLATVRVPERSLLPWLHSYVRQLFEQKADIAQLLYCIDVPEYFAEDNPALLAEKILLREAEKVLFRWQYSS